MKKHSVLMISYLRLKLIAVYSTSYTGARPGRSSGFDGACRCEVPCGWEAHLRAPIGTGVPERVLRCDVPLQVRLVPQKLVVHDSSIESSVALGSYSA